MNKKTYITPKGKVVDLETERLLADSAPSTGGYDNGGGTSGDGDGMDEDAPVKSIRLWDREW